MRELFYETEFGTITPDYEIAKTEGIRRTFLRDVAEDPEKIAKMHARAEKARKRRNG